jgi:hypothetical protein
MSRAIRTLCQLAAIAVGLVLTSSALAAPRKVLVLPLEGDVEPDTRAKYSAQVQRLARSPTPRPRSAATPRCPSAPRTPAPRSASTS